MPDDSEETADTAPGNSDQPEESGSNHGLTDIALGFPALDDTLGGIQRGSVVALIGDPATNMTTFALQFLHEGLATGEQVGLVAPMSQPSWLVKQADHYGWEFTAARETGALLVGAVAELGEGDSPAAVTEEVTRLADAGIDRLAFPNFDMYERLFETHDERLRTTRALLSQVQGSVTTFLTAEITESDPFQTHYRTVERVADVILEARQHHTQSRPKMSVSIRSANTNIDRSYLPYEITDDGVAVYGNASIF